MKLMNAVKLLTMVTLGTTMLYAQATRTWVSGVGDDANPCSRTAPCKTWAGAISKTAPGGEIDALDPGGFGAVTITKAITLDGGGGQVASILVSGTNGLIVQAGANDVVTLRHLRFNGIGTGFNGIRFLAGKSLNVEDCFIFGFTQNAIDIALNQGTQARVHVINTVINNNAGVGIRAANAVVPAVQVGIEDSIITVDNIGIEAAQHSRVVVNHSITEHATNDGMKADDATTGDAQLAVESSESTFNANGITAGAGSSVNVGGSRIINNGSCSLNNSGGTLFSFTQGGAGTNRVSGATCGTITPLPQ